MSESKFDISKLMDKPIWQMCGEEFVLLAEFAFSQNSLPARQEPQTQFIYGIQNLAAYIGCCASRSRISNSGKWRRKEVYSVFKYFRKQLFGKSGGQMTGKKICIKA